GRAAFSYSRDRGRTWDNPKYMPFKNPRAANFVWKCENGGYLYWFHNHGLRGYTDRNPAWIAYGAETDGADGRIIEWGQPEVLLYDDSEMTLISYPDMIEDGGRLFITETQKDIARVHEIPRGFIDRLMSGGACETDIPDGLLLKTGSGRIAVPPLPAFSMKDSHSTCFAKIDLRTGISFLVACGFGDSTIFDNRDNTGKGILIETMDGIVHISVCDGRTRNTWDSAPYELKIDSLNHIGIVIDGGPKIISITINGMLCDGGGLRPFGWCRFASQMTDLNASAEALVGDSVKKLVIYGRALMTCEAISCSNGLADDCS
ncbi:MAG: hypothetical protein JXB33_02900, partial [Clostridia bacterium]|nr:hypothetical protein [Clostridia bacterium]